MRRAPLGDDVFGDDPTVLALQDKAATLLGKEAALFVPTGTMANAVALRVHTEPGDEFILEQESHVYFYEGGGYAAMSGISAWGLSGDRGILDADQVADAIRPPGGLSHFPVTRLIWIENTHNRAGGTVYPLETLQAIGDLAQREDLRLHLDGARMFNAAVALGVTPGAIAAPFDSISFCLSKGLGCPAGSLFVGSKDAVARGHRFRKMFGGGMRQSGVLAAAGIHALDHHIERLADDHQRARRLGQAWNDLPGVDIDLETVQTNMVYADLTGLSSQAVVDGLGHRGVAITASSPTRVRAVLHRDIDDAGIDHAIEAMTQLVTESRATL